MMNDDDMSEEDANLIEQVSDDDDVAMQDNDNVREVTDNRKSGRGGSESNLDDEPPLEGYERYETSTSSYGVIITFSHPPSQHTAPI